MSVGLLGSEQCSRVQKASGAWIGFRTLFGWLIWGTWARNVVRRPSSRPRRRSTQAPALVVLIRLALFSPRPFFLCLSARTRFVSLRQRSSVFAPLAVLLACQSGCAVTASVSASRCLGSPVRLLTAPRAGASSRTTSSCARNKKRTHGSLALQRRLWNCTMLSRRLTRVWSSRGATNRITANARPSRGDFRDEELQDKYSFDDRLGLWKGYDRLKSSLSRVVLSRGL